MSRSKHLLVSLR